MRIPGAWQSPPANPSDYAAYAAYTFSASDVLASVRDFRSTLTSLGEASTPIEITEFGWPVAAGEAWRATAMARVAGGLANSNCGVDVLSPFTWLETDTGSDDYSLATQTGMLGSGAAWFSGLQTGARLGETSLCGPSGGTPPARRSIGRAASVAHRPAVTRRRGRRHAPLR